MDHSLYYTVSHAIPPSQQRRRLYSGGHLSPPLLTLQNELLPPWALGTVQPQGWRTWFGQPARPYEIDLSTNHGVILGTTESGISTSMQRLAFNAASHGWKVFLFDAQGSREDAIAFYAAMHTAGREHIHLFPGDAYGGWQGTGHALLHRLLQVSPFGREPYYQHIATAGLASVLLQDGPPVRDLDDLTQRLSRMLQQRRPVRRRPGNPNHISPFDAIRSTDMSGPPLRYSALSSLVGNSLNGSWSYDNADAAYFSFSAWSRPEEARLQARYLLADLASYLAERTQSQPRVLLLIKHPELLFDLEQITPLFAQMERARGSLFVSARSVADFGKAAPHVLKNASVLLIHRSQTSSPFEPYIPRPWWKSHAFFNGALQRLADRDCFAIAGGRVSQVHVTPAPLDVAEVVRATYHYTSPPTSSQGAHFLDSDQSIFFQPEDEEDDWGAILEGILGKGTASSESQAQETRPVSQPDSKAQPETISPSLKRHVRSRRGIKRLKEERTASSDTTPTS